MNMLVTRVMLVIKTKAMILMTCLHPPPCPASDHISTPAAPEMMSFQPSQPATMSITNWEGATTTKPNQIKIMSNYCFTWTPGLRLGKGEWDGEEVYVSEFDIFKKRFQLMRVVGIVIGIVRAPDSRGSEGISFRTCCCCWNLTWFFRKSSPGGRPGKGPYKDGKFLFAIFRPGEGPYEERVVIA